MRKGQKRVSDQVFLEYCERWYPQASFVVLGMLLGVKGSSVKQRLVRLKRAGVNVNVIQHERGPIVLKRNRRRRRLSRLQAQLADIRRDLRLDRQCSRAEVQEDRRHAVEIAAVYQSV